MVASRHYVLLSFFLGSELFCLGSVDAPAPPIEAVWAEWKPGTRIAVEDVLVPAAQVDHNAAVAAEIVGEAEARHAAFHEAQPPRTDSHGDETGPREKGAEAKPSSVSTALALMLMGSVAWIMSLFYYVNSDDSDIVKATWDVLSSMVSIFCAVLIFCANKDITVDFLGEQEGTEDARPDRRKILISVVRLLVAYGSVQGLLFCMRGQRKHYLKVVGSVGGHIVGFCEIEALGSLLQLRPVRPFHSNLFAALAILAFAALVLAALQVPMHCFRHKVSGCHEWKEQSRESENDGATLCLGLLISMVLRFIIRGHMPPIHGATQERSHWEVWLLFGASVGFAVLVVCFEIAFQMLLRHHGKEEDVILQHVGAAIRGTLCMTMGWSLLFWGQWLYWLVTGDHGVGEGDVMSSRVTLALVFSAMVFIGIRLVDFVADHASRDVECGLRDLIQTLGLLLGLSWEATFNTAVEGIGLQFEHPWRTLIDVAFTLGLCMLVLPAWAKYILPKTFEADEEVRRRRSSKMSLQPVRTTSDGEDEVAPEVPKASMQRRPCGCYGWHRR